MGGTGAEIAERKHCRRRRALAAANRSHGGPEPIASARNRDDVALILRLLAKRPPDVGNRFGDAVLFDHGVGPDRGQERILLEEPAAPDQCHQRVERLRKERDGHAVAKQQALPGVETKRAELEDALGCGGFHNTFTISSDPWKDMRPLLAHDGSAMWLSTNLQSGATARLTRVQWLICAVACIGFAFDTYEITVFAIVARPSLASFGLHPGAAEFNRWVGILLWVPQAAGGIFGLLGGYLTDRVRTPASAGGQHRPLRRLGRRRGIRHVTRCLALLAVSHRCRRVRRIRCRDRVAR